MEPREELKFKLLETVVLRRDLPEYGLKAGDLGAVVEIYEPDGLEVEFVTAAGKTQAVVTLSVKDVRKLEPSDMIAVRRLQPTQTKRGERMAATFELFKDSAGEYRWRLRHENGNIIADSGEGYTSKQSALDGIQSVKESAPDAPIADLTEN